MLPAQAFPTLVYVLDSSEDPQGMAFAISDDLYVTCAHVVADALDNVMATTEQRPTSLVRVRLVETGAPEAVLSSSVKVWRRCIGQSERGIERSERARSDIAVLQISGADKQKLRQPPLSVIQTAARLAGESFLQEPRPFLTWGAGHNTALVEGRVLPFHVAAEDGRALAVSNGNAAIVGGYSGAPAISYGTSGAIVLGMFVRANEEVGQARVIPAFIIREIVRKFAAVSLLDEPLSSESETVAALTLWLIDKLNRRSKVGELVSDAEAASGWVDQRNAFGQLMQAVQEWRPGSYLLTGPGGTGKSTVLREIARDLAKRFLDENSTADSPRNPLPVVINLKRAVLTPDFLAAFEGQKREPRALWSEIAAWWIGWANAVGIQRAAESGTIAARLPDNHLDAVFANRTVLIFDAVDEFLNRYPGIELCDIEGMVRSLMADPETGLPIPLVIIFGVRLGTEELDRLSTEATIRIGPLSRTAANRIIGKQKIDRLLSALDEPYAEQLVLTPLVLHALERGGKWKRIDNPTRVLETALQALLDDDPLREGGMTPRAGWSAQPMAERMGAITAVGWAFAELDGGEKDTEWIRGEQDFEQLHERTTRIAQRWSDERVDGRKNARAAAMIAGFRLAADKEMLEALLRRSVFEYTGRFSFSHRAWMETCIARYIAFSIERRRFDPLRLRTYYVMIFTRIGQLLEKPIDVQLVDMAIDEVRKTQFVIGNIAAILGYSLADIETAALHRLNKRLHELGPLARHVLVSTLSHRAARAQPGDPSLATIMDVLYPQMLDECITRTALPDGNAATGSLAWCYHKLFSQSIDREHHEFKWPMPTENDVESILAIACPGFNEEEGISLQLRSLQKGYLETIRSVSDNPNRLIAGVHYLLMLVLARARRASVRSTDSALQQIFDGGYQELESRIREYNAVPEVLRLFEMTRNIYRGTIWKEARPQQ